MIHKGSIYNRINVMKYVNTCEYIIKLLSKCFYIVNHPKKTFLYYLSSHNLKDKNNCIENIVIFEQFDTHNENNYIETSKYSHFVCNECRKNIIGEIFMFNDKSFCNTKCRKKSMDKINKLI